MKTKTTTLLIGGGNKEAIRNMRVSNRFDVPSVLWNGVYYFPYPKDIDTYLRNGIKTIGMQVIYRVGIKLYQDTMYLNEEKLNTIKNFAKEKQLI